MNANFEYYKPDKGGSSAENQSAGSNQDDT